MKKDRNDPSFGYYSSFPEEYFAVLRHIKNLAPFTSFQLGPFPKAAAMNARRSFYRFREALREASILDGDHIDPQARQYAAVANNCICTVITDEDGASWCVFRMSPLVSAMRALKIDTDSKIRA